MRPKTREELSEMFDYVGVFEKGLAPVRKGDECFHIHPDGKEAYSEKFDAVGDFNEEGFAWVQKGDKVFQIGRDGKEKEED
jgi:hypothetical protein